MGDNLVRAKTTASVTSGSELLQRAATSKATVAAMVCGSDCDELELQLSGKLTQVPEIARYHGEIYGNISLNNGEHRKMLIGNEITPA